MGDQTIAAVGDLVGELDATVPELGNRFLDVVTIERDVMSSGRRTLRGIRRVASHIGFRQIEDEPSFAQVGPGKAELVAKESSKLLRLRRVEHRMNAANHVVLLVAGDQSCQGCEPAKLGLKSRHGDRLSSASRCIASKKAVPRDHSLA